MGLAALIATSPVLGGEPGRLAENTEFLLGTWAHDCARGAARIFLSDGALRQEGLLRVSDAGGAVKAPITLLAATRDGVALLLESRSRIGGVLASSRYQARVVDSEAIAVKSVTLCRDARCQTTQLDLPWKRCAQTQ